jgi:hypothetical protein
MRVIPLSEAKANPDVPDKSALRPILGANP